MSVSLSMTRTLVSCVLLSLFQTVYSVEYFMSMYLGSDSNNGTTIGSPWRTFSRLNGVMSTLKSGDKVHFCQGDRWSYSMISAVTAGVTYDAYNCRPGVTSRPQITPAVDLNYQRWSVSPTNSKVLVYDLSTDSMALANGFKALWVNNIRYQLARWPNLVDPTIIYGQPGEFVSMTNISGTALTSPALQNFATNYWAGAHVTWRQANWIYFDAYVRTSTSAGVLQLDADWGTQPGFYFYMEANFNGRYSNHLQYLDQAGEWVLDVASKSIYLIPLNNATRDGILDGSIPVTGLYPNVAAAAVFQKATTVSGIEFTQGIGGVTVMSSSVTFTNNAITHVLERGFYVSSYQNNVLFQNNVVDDCESSCVQIMGVTSHVLYNNISRCGLYPRSTPSNTNGAWNGVTITGGTARGNIITGCGYTCIHPHAGSTVDSNIITDAMMTLNDGGAIYAYGTTDNYAVITNNVVRNTVGNLASYFGNPLAPCFYMDENSYGAQIRNNSCTTAPGCLMLNKAYSHTFMMNECQSPGIYINQGGNHIVAGNLMVSRGTNGAWQNPLFRMYDTVNLNYNTDFSVYDQAYCTLGPGYQFQRQTKNGTWRYDKFDDWKAAELSANINFERGSVGVTSCTGWKPIDLFSSDPWGFLKSSSSSSSSTGASSSAVSSSAMSSSAFSSSVMSSSVVSSSAQPSSTAESSSVTLSSSAVSSSAVSSTAESSSAMDSSSVEPSSTADSSSSEPSSTAVSSTGEPSSTAESSSASSSSSEPQGESSSSTIAPVPLGRCEFSGPFSQPTSTMTFTLTIDTVDIFTGERLMQDMSAWYAANQSISNMYDPSAVFPRGLQCGNLRPVSTTARRLLSSLYGTTLTSSSYVLTTYIVNVPQAVQLANVFTESVNEVGFTGPLSGSQVETGAAQVVQNCEDGLPVPVGGQCPETVQSSTADAVIPSSTASDSSSSSSSADFSSSVESSSVESSSSVASSTAESSSADFSSSVESSTGQSSSADFSSSVESSTGQSSSSDSSSIDSSSAESSSAQFSSTTESSSALSSTAAESSSFASSTAESSTTEPSSSASSSSATEFSSVAESSSVFESSSVVSSTADFEASSAGLESSSTLTESSSVSISSSASESSAVVESSSAGMSSTGAESSSSFAESSSGSMSSSTDIAASSTADVISSSSSSVAVDSSSVVPSSSALEASSASLSSSAAPAQDSSTAAVSSSEEPAKISSSAESNTVSQSSTASVSSPETPSQLSSSTAMDQSTSEFSTGSEVSSSTSCGENCFIPDSEESSHSGNSSSAEVGGVVGGIIGAIVLLVAAGFAVRYFRSSRSSAPSTGLYPWSSPSNNASSSPSWSPDFNALKSSPSMSPGPNHEPGLALASFNLQDSPDMSPRSSGFLRESPVAGHISAHDLPEVHHDHPKFSFTLSEAESNQPPSPFPIHGSYSPSQSNAPFLGAPISPIGPQSSNSWSPSQSCAQYQAMPPSPIGTSSQLQPPMSPVSPIVSGNKQTAPKTEYFRMPSTTFKLPSKGRLGFLGRNQPPSIPTFTSEPRITTLTVTPPPIPKVIPPPVPVTTSGGRMPPPIPTSQPRL